MEPLQNTSRAQDHGTNSNNVSADQSQSASRREFLGAALGAGLGALAMPSISLGEEPEQERRSTRIGDKFPEMKFKDVNGKELDLEKETAGKITIVEVWGPWCGPCLRQVPHLKEVSNKLKGKEFVNPDTGESIGSDFAVYTVAANFNSRHEEQWEGMINRGTFPGDLHTGTRDFAKLRNDYGVSSFPSNFVLDGDGRVLMKGVDVPSLPHLLKKYIKQGGSQE